MRLERLNKMEQYILEQNSVSLEQLKEHFQVSTNTIRRDVAELVRRGTVNKVYGGVSSKNAEGPLPFTIRSSKNSSSKQVIGRLAAELVNDGDTIFLDSGSTTVCMIPHLAKKQSITIITHSLSVMYEASKYPNLQVIALGGLYNATTSSYIGISTLDTLSQFSANAVFMAATGVSLERGLTNTTFFEAEIKRQVVQQSEKVILLADKSKFDYSSSITFYNFSDLYAVVTDEAPDERYLDVIRRNRIQLLCE